MGIDPITMSLAANKAKADLAESGAIGSVIPAKKYTFDGNIEEKPVIDEGDFVMVQISSDVVDVSTVQTVTVNNFKVPATEFMVVDSEEFGILGLDNGPYVLLPKTGGVFVRYEEGGDVVTEVACKETIIPIDPKYLPAGIGGGLPVVELTTLATEQGAVLTAEEVAKIEALQGEPCLMRFGIDGFGAATFTAPMLVADTGGGSLSYGCVTAFASIGVTNEVDDGNWVIQVSPLS